MWLCTKSQIACTRAQPGGLCRTGSRRCRRACRSRSSGCRAGTPALPPAGPASGSARASGTMTSMAAAVVDQCVAAERCAPWQHDPRAPVAEAVAVGGDGQRRVEVQVVARRPRRHPREVDVERHDHRRGLRAVVDHLKAGADSHQVLAVTASGGRRVGLQGMTEVRRRPGVSAGIGHRESAYASVQRPDQQATSARRSAANGAAPANTNRWLNSSSIPTYAWSPNCPRR